MSRDVLRRQRAGLILGLTVLGGPAAAQAPPEGPGLGSGEAPAGAIAPEFAPPAVLPRPPIIEVPPGGIVPGWAPGPIDPIAAARHRPKFVEHKRRWWHWRRYQGRLGGYPEEFEPRPLGAALHDHGRMMVANGAAAGLALYRYDFVDGAGMLNQRGLDQLSRMAAQLAASPYPLVIERTPDDPSLAEARRLAVIEALGAGPYPVPADRVLVGMPIARGLPGVEAEMIGINALERVKDVGPTIPINSNGVNSPSGVTSR